MKQAILDVYVGRMMLVMRMDDVSAQDMLWFSCIHNCSRIEIFVLKPFKLFVRELTAVYFE